MILFKLPIELIHLTLSFLSPQEIQDLFDVNEIFQGDYVESNKYFKIRLIGLYEYFNNRKLMISNSCYDHLDYVKLGLQQLEYLQKENILVNPRELSVYINDRLPIDEVQQICKNELIKFVTSWSTKSLRFQLELFDSNLPEEILNIVANNWKLDEFSLKYNGMLPNLDGDFNIKVNKLKLQLPDCHKFLYYINQKQCFNNVRWLDLSFNGINDISQVKFPTSLIYLNLSNNNLTIIDDYTFCWKELTNLQTLDLSNNNIQYFNLRRTTEKNYQLKRLKLSGNHLTTVPKLYNCNIFHNLIELDLSRNMLCYLHRFPQCLTKLSLRGNYLSQFHTQVQGDIFPKSLTHLDLSHCRICCQVATHLLNVEKLYNLSVLQV